MSEYPWLVYYLLSRILDSPSKLQSGPDPSILALSAKLNLSRGGENLTYVNPHVSDDADE